MKKLMSNEIRSIWLKYFEDRGHYVVPSGSLIPIEDDSLLWINSGVATLKKYFEGREKPPSPRLTNSQKSIRTGDIENVGVTARHHTFFEMLGNFSIGDYFKLEAIEFAYTLLTSEEYFGIPIDKLWITVFEEDEEALERWVELGFPRERIFKMSRETNFWDMGKGPCGPSTEMFFDRGEKYDSRSAEELIKDDLENDRFVEIWNVVFSQYNNDGENNYTELPQKNIDTGAGLERFASVFQDTPTNFETDLFRPIIEKIVEISGKEYVWDYIPGELSEEQEDIQRAMKAIADFSRTATFAIGDGVIPSNNGRGYVIRRLLRRAVSFGVKLGIEGEFIYKLPEIIAKIMGDFYPEVVKNQEIIIDKIKAEEIQFGKTLSKSSALLKTIIDNLEGKEIPADKAFELYETHGLPFEFIEEMAVENNLTVSKEGFDALLKDFQDKSRANQKDTSGMGEQKQLFRGMEPTKFVGYDHFETESKVVAIEGVNIALEETPFYATSGGQESDRGTIDGIKVLDVYKNGDNVFIHVLESQPTFNEGDTVKAEIDGIRREKLMRNHSSIHLTFAALEKILDFEVPQVGSKVEEDFFRFDFVYHKEINKEILAKVQEQVEEWIKQQVACDVREITLAEARETGVTILEGTKYGDTVRVVDFPGVTADLCGGTHVENTFDIQEIILTSIEKKGSGTFRITGVSGSENVAKARTELAHETRNKVEEEIRQLRTVVDNAELHEIINNGVSELEHKPALEVLEEVKDKVEKLNEKLQDEITNQIMESSNSEEKISSLVFNNINKKFLAKTIKELTSKLNDKIIIIQNNNNSNANVAFVLGNEVDQNKFETDLKESLSKFESIRGGGGRQLHQYGGPKTDVIEMIIDLRSKY